MQRTAQIRTRFKISVCPATSVVISAANHERVVARMEVFKHRKNIRQMLSNANTLLDHLSPQGKATAHQRRAYPTAAMVKWPKSGNIRFRHGEGCSRLRAAALAKREVRIWDKKSHPAHFARHRPLNGREKKSGACGDQFVGEKDVGMRQTLKQAGPSAPSADPVPVAGRADRWRRGRRQ